MAVLIDMKMPKDCNSCVLKSDGFCDITNNIIRYDENTRDEDYPLMEAVEIPDAVNKQEAIDALGEEPEVWMDDEYALGLKNQWRYDVNALKALHSAQPERSSEIQDILKYLDTVLHPIISPENWNVYSELHDMISMLSSTQSKKEYTKADYIMALHKEYGCDLTRAEKAHNKALEYLRDTAILKG